MASTAVGLSTIRAFRKGDMYTRRMHARLGWHLSLGIHWYTVRTGLFAAAYVAMTASAGLSIAFALQLQTSFEAAYSSFSRASRTALGVDRILSLAAAPQEPEAGENPAAWPTKGQIDVETLRCGMMPIHGPR